MALITLKSSADTYISQYYGNLNFGSSSELYVSCFGGPTGIYRTLLKFDDIKNIIPSTSTIENAEIRMFIYRNEIPSGSISLNAYHVLENWDENSVTWNTAPLVSASSDGVVGVTIGALGWVSIPITQLAKSWYDGSITNNGVLIRGNETYDCLLGFYSKNNTDTSIWPQLLIKFVDGVINVYPPQTLWVLMGSNSYSSSISLGAKTATSFSFKNTGTNLVSVNVQISNDGTNYYDAFYSDTVNPGATTTFTTTAAAKFVRTYANGVTGNSTVIVSAASKEK